VYTTTIIPLQLFPCSSNVSHHSDKSFLFLRRELLSYNDTQEDSTVPIAIVATYVPFSAARRSYSPVTRTIALAARVNEPQRNFWSTGAPNWVRYLHDIMPPSLPLSRKIHHLFPKGIHVKNTPRRKRSRRLNFDRVSRKIRTKPLELGPHTPLPRRLIWTAIFPTLSLKH